MLSVEFLNLPTEDTSKRGLKAKKLLADEATTDSKPNSFTLKLRETNITKTTVCDAVLNFLGRIGGLNHMIISSDFRNTSVEAELGREFVNGGKQDSKYEKLIAWDHENQLTFPLPLFSKKIDVNVSKILPRVISLVTSSTDRKTKLTACELLHTVVVYMIGQTANRSKKDKHSGPDFNNLYEHIFPAIFQIAADVEDVSTKIFNTLCLQVVRWFSNSKEYEHTETATLLDTLINCVSVRDNSNLREFAAICIGEFVKWTIKQLTKKELTENYGNIKSVIRRIQNNANHPDIYNRYGAILAMKQSIVYLREEDFLVEKYALELMQTTLTIVKMSHHSTKVTEEMTENMYNVLKKLQDVIIRRWELLEDDNKKRGGSLGNVYDFVDWLFEQILSFETLFANKSAHLWENLVDAMIKKTSSSKSKKHLAVKSHKDWILKKMDRTKIIFKNLHHELDFTKKKQGDEETSERVSLLIKNYQLLDAQLNVSYTLLELFLILLTGFPNVD